MLGVRLDGRVGMCELIRCIGAGSDAGWEPWHYRVVDRHKFTIRYSKDTIMYIYMYTYSYIIRYSYTFMTGAVVHRCSRALMCL